MKVILIAAMDPNGVIGRTRKPCPLSNCHNGRVYNFDDVADCAHCAGTGTVPANDLPWGRAYPEIDARIDAVTMGHAVVMGRRTWESLPPKSRPLPGRTNVVVSKTLYAAPDLSVFCALQLDHALAWCRDSDIETAFVIGGARLFAEALPIADELDLTLISRAWEGDVLFPTKLSIGGQGLGSPYIGGEGYAFKCVERTPGEHPDLTHTRWVRR